MVEGIIFFGKLAGIGVVTGAYFYVTEKYIPNEHLRRMVHITVGSIGMWVGFEHLLDLFREGMRVL